MKKRYFLIGAMIFVLIVSLSSSAFSGEVGQPSPEFQFRTLAGEKVSLEMLKGEKPVFLVFWATWCRKCKEEVPVINELYQKLMPMGMEFLGVDIGVNDSEERVKRFVDKTGLSYPVAFDSDGELSKKFRVYGTPTIVVIDKNGIIRYRASDVPRDLEKRFSSLMGS